MRKFKFQVWKNAPIPPKLPRGERFFPVEVAKFLQCPIKEVMSFCRQKRLLRHIGKRAKPKPELQYLNASGVRALVRHIRAQQGEEFMRRRDPIAEHLRALDTWRRTRRRKKAKLAGLLLK